MRRAAIGAIAVAAACAPVSPAPHVVHAPEDAPAAWVEEQILGMTLQQKAAQLIFPKIPGTLESVASDEFRALYALMRRNEFGGVLVGVGSPLEVATRLNALQVDAPVPLLAAADLEFGAGMRLWPADGSEGGTVFPYAMGYGAAADTALVAELARVTAAEARAVGIHWVLAPVADLNTNAANPVINVRSFGEDPRAASALIEAYVRAAEHAGVLTAPKHLPGHGESREDSHVALPLLDLSRARLDAVELAPFRAAVAAGASALMIGHLAVPALTGDSALPASLSHDVVSTLVRRQLGFNGIVVADALDMAALQEAGAAPGEIAVRAVRAGSDVVLAPPDPEAALAAIVAAVRSGALHESRIDASVRRILAAKARLGLPLDRLVALEAVPARVGAAAQRRLALRAAERSLVLARDPRALVPLDARRVRSVAAIAFTRAGELERAAPFREEMVRQFGDVRWAAVEAGAGRAAIARAATAAHGADAVVLAVYHAPVSGAGQIRLPEPAGELARALRDTGAPFIVVSFGDPFGPATLEPDAYLLAWQPHGDAAQIAAARALAGRGAVDGTLPVSLPGMPRGTGLRTEARATTLVSDAQDPRAVGFDPAGFRRIDRTLMAAVAGGATPGAAVAVGRRGRLALVRGYGALDTRSGFGAVTDSTIYDLASLTKAVGTTTAAMLLYEDGRLDLDAPISRYLPEWQRTGTKARVTVRHLLQHTSGLPAYAPLWRELSGREAFLRRIGAMGLEHAPGTRTLYTDLGMILLGAIVERISGHGLDVLLERRVFGPLGMRDTGFDPLGLARQAANHGASDDGAGAFGPGPGPDLLSRIAPTERDTVFRGVHVHGAVQDENAWAMGGVAGHAGLFSSARDLAIFAQMILNGGIYGDMRVLKPSTVRLFTERRPQAQRALGWDLASRSSTAGDYFPPSAFGHTGFTGTSLWIDPDHDLFVVLLTNRLNPTRANQRHIPLRRAVHDAVQLAITDAPVTRRSD